MRLAAALLLVAAWLASWPGGAAARVHGPMYCWALDSELPVVCEPEEDEEGLRPPLPRARA